MLNFLSPWADYESRWTEEHLLLNGVEQYESVILIILLVIERGEGGWVFQFLCIRPAFFPNCLSWAEVAVRSTAASQVFHRFMLQSN